MSNPSPDTNWTRISPQVGQSTVYGGADEAYGIGEYSPFDPTRFLWNRKENPAGVWVRTQQMLGILLLLCGISATAAADTLTPNLLLIKPTIGVVDTVTPLGVKLNGNFDKIDAGFGAIQQSTSAILSQLAQLGIATTTLQANIDAETLARILADAQIGVSTASLQVQINAISGGGSSFAAIGASTASLQVQVNNLNTSTATIFSQLNQVALSTNALQANINAVAVSTNVLQGEINAIGASTRTVTAGEAQIKVLDTGSTYSITTIGVSSACPSGQTFSQVTSSNGIITGGICSIVGAAGPAGGVLADTYPNPTFGSQVVLSTHIADGAVGDSKTNLSTGAILSGKFGDDRVSITTGAITSGFFTSGITTGCPSGFYLDQSHFIRGQTDGGVCTLSATASTLTVVGVVNDFTSLCNGITTVFTLGTAPASSTTLSIVLDGLTLQGGGRDYLYTSPLTITLTTAPATGCTNFFAQFLSTNSVGNAGGTITGLGSNGQVTFWTAPTVIAGDSSLTWDNALKRLGIGNSPQAPLDVNGSALFGSGTTRSTMTATGDIMASGQILAQKVSTYSIVSSSGINFLTPATGIVWADGSVSTTAFGGAGGTAMGTGAAGRVAFWESINTLTSSAPFTYDGTTLNSSSMTTKHITVSSRESGFGSLADFKTTGKIAVVAVRALQAPGTVATNATVELVGTGTEFLTTFEAGDAILVEGETVQTVQRVVDDTHLFVSITSFTTTASGLSYGFDEDQAAAIVFSSQTVFTGLGAGIVFEPRKQRLDIDIANNFGVNPTIKLSADPTEDGSFISFTADKNNPTETVTISTKDVIILLPVTIASTPADGYSLAVSSGIDASGGCINLEGGQFCGPAGQLFWTQNGSSVSLKNISDKLVIQGSGLSILGSTFAIVGSSVGINTLTPRTNLDVDGVILARHFEVFGGTPTLTSCGHLPVSTGTDMVGEVKTGTGPPGTVTTDGTVNLIGVLTTFLTDFAPGDTILVQGEGSRVVDEVVTNTHLKSTVAFSTTLGGLAYDNPSCTLNFAIPWKETPFCLFGVSNNIPVLGSSGGGQNVKWVANHASNYKYMCMGRR